MWPPFFFGAIPTYGVLPYAMIIMRTRTGGVRARWGTCPSVPQPSISSVLCEIQSTACAWNYCSKLFLAKYTIIITLIDVFDAQECECSSTQRCHTLRLCQIMVSEIGEVRFHSPPP